ncbi:MULTISPECIES: branched-chain amino acid ABC transporter substrate-binding protein [unclassified Paraburkholderia]|uniref:branched-chain amino acid ABC transporter substrate-binding protein n=1 Tax=unclassified Paraburkholderia TaxID=2615204 RepID=UPI001614719D|nr:MULTISPECIES: branched-chain amino acid ABC transporter substrate-binding protein [unclassified Paraburkholderia]MBB5446613.1 branched-chain amino acid transport system substrate-binding protein [Paraburkholderia sp. WSM4177]MBB5487158.1 branched-chain amino acid transport system substrate-binding protein [Paraburkholderia sp. WSM4180]
MKRRNLVVALALGMLCAHAPSYGAEPQIVKIGFVGPLTGPVARVGKDLQNGAQLAVDEANAKHPMIGGKPVKYVLDVQDDQADPRIAIQVAQKLVDDGVVGVIGHYNSGCSIPASAVYHTANVAMITPGSTNPALTAQGFANVFRTMGHDGVGGVIAGEFAVQQLKAKRIGIIDDRTAFGQGLADAFEKGAKQANGNIVDREFTNDKAVDLRAILTSLKQKNVDLIFFGGLDEQGAMLVKQMRSLGMPAQLFGAGALKSNAFLQIAGNAGEGTRDLEPGPALDKLPSAQEFGKRYKARFNQDVELYAPFAYDAALAMIQAIQDADSLDRARIVAAFPKVNVTGVTGKIAFDPHGDLIKPPYTLFEVQQGQWKSQRTVGGGV